ncbi:MAG: hypothetical protein QM791_03845 [Ferruginibacter sp.]
MILKGNANAVSAGSGSLPGHSFSKNFTGDKSNSFDNPQNGTLLLEHVLMVEDTDDDDYSCEKKKYTPATDYTLNSNPWSFISTGHSFKNHIAAGKESHPSFDHLYIFIRSIRV